MNNLRQAFIITRREIRDQFRDWRIIFPILILTIVFPALMNFTARQAVNFVQRYNAPLVAERMIPFLLMIVGFFPISVSLVIALESFVGEKERRSIEPLLCTPLSDIQVYLGKLMAAMVPPLLGSYLGISVYLIGLAVQIGWTPPPRLLLQIVLLTTVQAVVMVSGAVVISSQTTSVRAANLLASFIIIPMAFLIQGESIIMFWARYNILWLAIIGQVLIAGLLIRTGVAYFNREELLGRELDALKFGWALRRFKQEFVGNAKSIGEWYFKELTLTLWGFRLPIIFTILSLAIGFFAGIKLSRQFTVPAELVSFSQLGNGFIEGLEGVRFFTPQGAGIVWLHNLRSVLIAGLLGIFSFGVLGLLVMSLPMTVIGYVTGNVILAGGSAGTFLAALVLPHALFELPAIILSGAAILDLGASVTKPIEGRTIGEAWLIVAAKCTRIMIGIVIPLFLIAALVEVFITPHIAVMLLSK